MEQVIAAIRRYVRSIWLTVVVGPIIIAAGTIAIFIFRSTLAGPQPSP
jgi:hypothetical protein